jgi:hypothetical protein
MNDCNKQKFGKRASISLDIYKLAESFPGKLKIDR